MANFAVSASDSSIARGKELIDKFLEPGMKQEDALNRIFDAAEQQLSKQTLRAEGVNADELEATLRHLRDIYVGAVSGRQELIDSYNKNLEAIRVQNEQITTGLMEQIRDAEDAKKQAEQAAEADRELSEQVREQNEQLKSQIAQLKQDALVKDKLVAAVEDKRDRLNETVSSIKSEIEEIPSLREKIANLEAERDKLKSDMERQSLNAEKAALSAQKKHQDVLDQLRIEHREEIKDLKLTYDEEIRRQREAYTELYSMINSNM